MVRPDRPRRLIVNADDFGRSSSINQAVVRAHREGCLTTASLMVNEPGFEEAVALARAHPRLGVVESALRGARFTVEVVADAKSLVWGKLVVNTAINPLTALLRVPNGELLQRPSARTVMSALAKETASVASAQKVSLPFENPIEAAENVARKTASNHSSMFQDVRRGAPTEIDAICGAVTRAGERHGVPTPVNRVCWQLVQAMATAR